ncbi:hypothetical protein ACHAXN_001010, partial [Cyclotella atomus]
NNAYIAAAIDLDKSCNEVRQQFCDLTIQLFIHLFVLHIIYLASNRIPSFKSNIQKHYINQMKSVVSLSICLNVVAAASLNRIAMQSPPSRRAQDEKVNSNDKIDYLSFQKYNCDGMFLDWTGPSTFTTALSAKIVEYDYDAYLEAGSDRTVALASIQNRLLRYVGEEVIGDCRRRLSEGYAIEEINTAPGDQPSLSTAPCVVEAEFSSTECIAVHGAMTIYYSSSGDAVGDEANIDSAVKAAVKRGMDISVPVTDTVTAVYYIGDRDNYSVTKSLFMTDNGSQPAFWDRGGARLAVGLSSAVFAAMLLILCCRMRKSRSEEKDLSVLDKDVEIGQEITTQKSFKSKYSIKSTKKDETEVEDASDDSATHKFGMICCWK